MAHNIGTILYILFPSILVLIWNRSFIGKFVHRWRAIPRWLRDLLTCPLCFGFHVSWAWFLLLYYVGTLVYEPMYYTPLVLGSSAFCYILEILVSYLEVLKRSKELEASNVPPIQQSSAPSRDLFDSIK